MLKRTAIFVVVASITYGCRADANIGGRIPPASSKQGDASIPAPPKWHLTEALRIDGYAADLVPVGDIAVARDGAIALLQNQDHIVRFFDAAGNPRGWLGGSGEGPGEFKQMYSSGWLGDTLWIFDVALRRYTFISPSREFMRNVFPPKQVRSDGDKLTEAEAYRATVHIAPCPREHFLAFVQPASPNVPVPGERDDMLVSASADGSLNALLMRYNRGITTVAFRTGTGYQSTSIPFSQTVSTDGAPDGSRVALAKVYVDGPNAGTLNVLAVSCDGDTIFDRWYGFEKEPIPTHVADSVLDAQASRLRERAPGLAAALRREAKVPPLYPPVSRVLTGRDGTIWINLRGHEGYRPWLVLDPRGNPIGTIVVNGATTLYAADRTSIWATETDENDVESVVMYHIR